MMVKVLIYGYATDVFSSRKLARKLHEGVAFQVLAAGNFPAHRTICDFRAFHLTELSALFVQVVQLGQACGLARLGTIAVDGTKIKANASRHKAMSYERMQKAELELKGQIDALLAKAGAADQAEKSDPDLDIPAELARREDRLAVISAARARLEERQRQADIERGRSADDDDGPPAGNGEPKKKSRYKYRFGEPKPKAQENFTDPESRIMFDEFPYAARSWPKPWRVLLKAEVMAQGENPRFVVTSLVGLDAGTLYEDIYCARGQSENFIKHLKNDLSADRTSCTSFLANCMRLLLHAAAYVLHQQLRTQALQHTALSQAQPSTVIARLFKIAVQVRQGKQRVTLHLPSACPVKHLLHTLTERLFVSLRANIVNSS